MELNWFQKLLTKLASRILLRYKTVEIRPNSLIIVSGHQYIVKRTEIYAGGQVELEGEEVGQYLDSVRITQN
ncbi:hypothetical protein SP15_175 [Bacillus phage SP-15]|uniref:Uncharacterized protein n=1 Tax=Bacillus phage SP-15 TaxID=1792032 RepID=A0A127AWL0_9CAUD|nr:hypothetical protein SP15_175 [Bacillus phage SP-15]AMM44973.1 hypothetical protein SP15_175 [Bacillus phage SP-15]